MSDVAPETLVLQLAAAEGFDAVRITVPDPDWAATGRLQAFLEAGRHGAMDWMETTADRRSHPQAMWPEARSAIVLGLSYAPDHDPLQALDHPARAAISVYAQGDDYHDVVKKKLKAMAGALHRALKAPVKVFVDTAPLMEKPLAAQAGLGWQGKHTNLVSRQHGSWLFLGVILTSAELAPDSAESDHCGTCRACLDICPTGAFPAPYQLDARRCISYLTIEHPGPIPEAFRAAMGNRIYGCDDCLAVCPWNKFAQVAGEASLQAREALRSPALEDLAALDDAGFRALFRKNPVKRIGLARFLRNVAIALGNSGRPELAAAAERLAGHESPLVRGAAAWALGRLLTPAAAQARAAAALADEADADVAREWQSLLPAPPA